ncbi:MAG: rare lipoprotein [Herminiimonas sp.]|nr:rare lipoprotein [Herminiimonas sp.]
MGLNQKGRITIALFLLLSWCISAAGRAQEPVPADAKPAASKAPRKAGLDRSGKARKGKASYYGREFYGKKMADGTPMNPKSNVAASKTLPLGTKAKVTNLENGKSEVVEIKDRGPYVKDRIVDLSPMTADKLDIKEQGVAPVEVKPIEVPQPDGTVKPGAAALEAARDKGNNP